MFIHAFAQEPSSPNGRASLASSIARHSQYGPVKRHTLHRRPLPRGRCRARRAARRGRRSRRATPGRRSRPGQHVADRGASRRRPQGPADGGVAAAGLAAWLRRGRLSVGSSGRYRPPDQSLRARPVCPGVTSRPGTCSCVAFAAATAVILFRQTQALSHVSLSFCGPVFCSTTGRRTDKGWWETAPSLRRARLAPGPSD